MNLIAQSLINERRSKYLTKISFLKIIAIIFVALKYTKYNRNFDWGMFYF